MNGSAIPFVTGFSRRWVLWAAWLACVPALRGQQYITFTSNFKPYNLVCNWEIKHGNQTYKNQTEHTLDWAQSPSFDLTVYFSFQGDSMPADRDIGWGFQYAHPGDLLSPPSREKNPTRSPRSYQTFQISGSGTTTIVLTSKAYKKTGSQFEPIGQARPLTLTFHLDDRSRAPVASVVAPVDTIATDTAPAPPATAVPAEAAREETSAYQEAVAIQDTIQKVKALIDFVDKYAEAKPKSELVAKAIKNIPLGVSMPDDRGDGTYSLTLHYAVKPVIDSAQVRGWRYKLAPTEFGKYKLTLFDLKDSVHSIKIRDIGKNAPYDRPKEIQPFERIVARLVKEDRDSFWVRVDGGTPPFIAFISQKGVARERYIIPARNVVKAFAKASCVSCAHGAHTLEVYTSDFSTLLLRQEEAVHIFKPNYFLLVFYGVSAFLLLYLGYPRLVRLLQILAYQRKLNQIDKWERRETQKRK